MGVNVRSPSAGRGVAVVVGDIGAEEDEIIGQEGREFVADPALGAPFGDKREFAFWVVVPDAAEVFALDALAGNEFGGGEG